MVGIWAQAQRIDPCSSFSGDAPPFGIVSNGLPPVLARSQSADCAGPCQHLPVSRDRLLRVSLPARAGAPVSTGHCWPPQVCASHCWSMPTCRSLSGSSLVLYRPRPCRSPTAFHRFTAVPVATSLRRSLPVCVSLDCSVPIRPRISISERSFLGGKGLYGSQVHWSSPSTLLTRVILITQSRVEKAAQGDAREKGLWDVLAQALTWRSG